MKEVWTCSENQQIPYSSLITWFSTFFGVYHGISACLRKAGWDGKELDNQQKMYSFEVPWRYMGFVGERLKTQRGFCSFFDVVAILIQWIWICLSPNHLCLNQQQTCISCIKALQAMGSLPCWNSNNINRIERTQGFQPLSFQYALLSLEQYAKYCQIPFGWWLYKGPKYKDTIQYIVGYHNPWMDRQYQSA